MKIVTTFHPSSSVVSSVKCRLASRDVEHLVVAKLNNIDVYSLQPHGLQHECGVEIWGKVMCVKAIPIPRTGRSKLVLMIGHPDPELVFFSYSEHGDGRKELTVNTSLSLFERTPRPAEFFNDLLIHPSGEFAVACCYSGRLKVLKLKSGDHAEDFDLSLPELNVLSLALLPKFEDKYPIAILHLDYQGRVQLLARDIAVSGQDSDISALPSVILPPTCISNKVIEFPSEIVPHLISVPPGSQPDDDLSDASEDSSFQGGVLIIGGCKFLFYELASARGQEKQRGKLYRMEAAKSDPAKFKQSKAKQLERETKRRKPTASVQWPWGEVTAWCAVDDAPFRFFLGDEYGALSLLSLDTIKEQGLILIPLGVTSPATTLTYLTNQVLYVGSHLGDSQLVSISPAPSSSSEISTLSIPESLGIKTFSRNSPRSPKNKKGKNRSTEDDMDVDKDAQDEDFKGRVMAPDGSFIKVLSSFKNIAPILDAVMVDTEGSGQQQLVTCSGAQSSGSLNIVRNGAEFRELGSIPGILNITGLWSVRPRFEANYDSHIVVSMNDQTLLFKINDKGPDTTLIHVDATSARDFVSKEPTLAFANVAKRGMANGRSVYGDSTLLVQIVASGAYLLEYDNVLGGFTELARWLAQDLQPGNRINEVVAASVNSSQAVLALSGGRLVVLRFEPGAFQVSIQHTFSGYKEVSAVSCIPLDGTKKFSPYVALAYWNDNSVEVFILEPPRLVSVAKSQTPLPGLVRSLLLYNFGSDSNPKGENYHAYLICGLANGSVVHFSWKAKQLQDQKVISLGHAPVHLTDCKVDGKRCVFAAGNRATALSFEKKRLIHSPVMLKDLAAVCRLDTTTFPNCLVLAGSGGLSIGAVQELNKLSIRTIPLGYDNPRCIVHVPLAGAFAVAFIVCRPTRVGEFEDSNSCLKLLDETSYEVLSQFNCDAGERISSLTEFTRDVDGKTISYICAGTSIDASEERAPPAGRLLVFTTVSSETRQGDKDLSLLTSTPVGGCVYALKTVEGQLVAAVDATIFLYGFETDPVAPSSFTLKQLSEWNHNYRVTTLGSYGNHIVTGDQLSSISLLNVRNGKLSSEARDYGPLWPIAVEALGDKHIIGSNSSSNLFTFSLSRGVERKMLERDGSYHLGDLVTKFIRGSLSSDVTGGGALEPESIFFTSTGRIGIIIDVKDKELSLHLTELQRNLSAHIHGVGGDSHTKFRAPKGYRGRSDADSAAFGFIDGDFLESFLGLIGNPSEVEKVVAGQSAPERLTYPVESFQEILGTLQSLH